MRNARLAAILEDNKAIQTMLPQIVMYPLAE